MDEVNDPIESFKVHNYCSNLASIFIVVIILFVRLPIILGTDWTTHLIFGKLWVGAELLLVCRLLTNFS